MHSYKRRGRGSECVATGGEGTHTDMHMVHSYKIHTYMPKSPKKVEDITGYILTQTTRQHRGTTIRGTTPVLVTMKSCEVLACECGKVTLRWFAGKSTLEQQTNFSTEI